MKIKLLLMIMALGVLMMSGCQQVNDMVNSNKATNTNTATNSNATANSNANSNVTANSNANANTSASPTNSATNANSQASNTAANNAAATKEEVPLTPEAKVFKNNLVGEWVDDVKTKHKFTENEYELNIGTSRYYKGSYKVVNENTLELVSSDGYKDNVTMRIEGDGNTLIWKQGDEEWTFKRVNPK